jgi:hypothetical protein
MRATTTIQNLINGNLIDACDDAKHLSAQKLIDGAMGMGYNYNEALIMACYLKGVISFQDYCDNFNNTK